MQHRDAVQDHGSAPIRVGATGLITAVPSHLVPPDGSPDALNVLYGRSAVEKRAGFASFLHQRPRAGAVRNRGHHGRARHVITVGAADADYLIVPGYLWAAHHEVYDDEEVREALTVSCLLTVDDLTLAHGGNADPGGTFGSPPYTIEVRPILSKGPVKRTEDPTTLGPAAGGVIAWSTTSRWGPFGADQHAMPFCLYLDNAAGIWEFAFAFHHKDSIGDWQLSRVNLGSMPVKVGVTYHVQGRYDVAGNLIAIRAGYQTHQGFVYLENSDTLEGTGPHVPMPRCTTGVVQVFDCPQEFIEAPVTPSATRPPGLGFSTAGYFFAAKRFEGTIEDIAIYRGSGFAPDLVKTARIDPDNTHLPLVNYWPGDGAHDQALDERSGRGNRLWKAPAGPITETRTGPDASGVTGWVFNGTTSYALAEMDNENSAAGTRGGNPNWRYAGKDPLNNPVNPLIHGAWQACVYGNFAHGLEIAFRAAAIESQFEQVLIEAHAVLRLVIGTDGFLRGYCRNDSGYAAAPLYQAAFAVSTTRIVPGKRYHVTLMRLAGGTSLELRVQGNVEDTQAVLASSASGWPVSGLTVGFGSLQFTSQIDSAAPSHYAEDGVTARTDDLNTDSRSGFVGTVESFRVLIGSIPTTYPLTIHRPFDAADYEHPQSGIWRYPRPGTPTIVEPAQFPAAGGVSTEPVANLAAGHGLTTPQVALDGRLIAKVISDGTQPTHYVLPSAIPTFPEGGVSQLEEVRIKTMRALGAWDLTSDDEIDYAGSYDPGVEWRTLTGFLLSENAAKVAHVQRSQVVDQLGFLNRLRRLCVESDTVVEAYDGPGGMDGQTYSHRLKPYLYRSPRELAPRWIEGLADAPVGESPITLLTDWTHELSGERLLMVGSRRCLYWGKGAWRRDTPFADESLAKSLWLHGRQHDYCVASTNSIGGTTYQVDLWCKPLRLDGRRLLVLAGGNTVTGAGGQLETEARYGIATYQGALVIFGVNRSGGGLRYFWAHVESGTSLRLGEWNHVHVEITATAVAARINGIEITLNVDPGTDPIATETHVPSTMLWVGGVDAWRRVMRFEVNGGVGADLLIEFDNWHGYLSELRERSVISGWTAGVTGTPPTERYEQDATDPDTTWHYPADDATWLLEDRSTNEFHAEVAVDELVPIAEELSDSLHHPYDSAVFRDQLFVTNGKARPQQVLFSDIANRTPFEVRQVGIDAPGFGNGHPEFTSYTAGTRWAAAGYTFWIQFENADGVVSEASPFLSIQLASGFDYVRLWQIPRSADPQVVARLIFVSVQGATARFLFRVADNESRDVELANGTPFSATFLLGNNLPAPRALFCTVANGALYLANLEGNGGAFAVSGDLPDYFPAVQQLPLDSEDGKPITGIAHTLSAVFLFKRDATFRLDFRSASVAGLDLYVTTVIQGSGAGGGAVVHENAIYGGGNRGVYLSNGAQNQLLSGAIDPTYQGLDISDAGLARQRGAYLWTEGQLWLSVRRPGERHNDRVLVFDEGRWFLLAVPAHMAIAVIVDEATQRARLLLGTVTGRVLNLAEGNVVDGALDAPHHGGAATLEGTATSGTVRTLTMSGATFDVAYGGLAGMLLRIFDAAGLLVAERVVETNTATQIVWREALSSPVAAGYTFVLGPIDAYWTLPWLAPAKLGAWHQLDHVDLEGLPQDTDLALDNAMADTTPVTQEFPSDFERRLANLVLGYFDNPFLVETRNRGRYHRIRFGTYGIRDTFAVTTVGPRYTALGHRGRPA